MKRKLNGIRRLSTTCMHMSCRPFSERISMFTLRDSLADGDGMLACWKTESIPSNDDAML